MVLVIERVRADLGAEVGPVGRRVPPRHVLVARGIHAGSGLTGPRSPNAVLDGFHLHVVPVGQKVETMPPWWVMSRYQSAAPSQTHMAARAGGWSDATCHWLIP